MGSDNLLSIPTKHTRPVEFEKVLTQVIADEFYQPPSSFSSQLRVIDELRGYVVAPQPTIESISALRRYYVQFSALRLKLPSDCLEFSWSPAFGKHLHTCKSLLFEQCNTLFVIGSLYSQIARSQDRFSPEGLKKAGVFFQYAAGCFKTLDNKNLSGSLDEIPIDLTTNSLSSFTYLMLASAQEVYWLKAVTDNLKDTVVSKLSLQAAEFYTNAGKLMEIPTTSLFPKEWINFCRIKALHFRAASYYRLAMHSGHQEKHGEEISLLRFSAELVEEGLRIETNNGQVLEDIKNLSKVVHEELRRAERENDLIYLEPIPSVPIPSKANLVKPMILSELLDPLKTLRETNDYGEPFFDKLLPYSVIQLASSFKERCIEYKNSHISHPIDELNKAATHFTEDLNLDYKLDSVLRPQTVPTAIYQHAVSLKEMGGLTRVENMLSDLRGLKLNCREELDSSWGLLKRASEDDASLRALYGAKRWTLRPVGDETADIKRSLGQLEEYLGASSKGDGTIHSQVEQLAPFVEVYESDEALESFIPKSEILELNPELKDLIRRMKEQVIQLEGLRAEREKFVQNVQAKLDSTDMLAKVIERYRGLKEVSVEEAEYESVLQTAILEFNTDLSFVEKSRKAQDQIMIELRKMDVEFLGKKRDLRVSREREEALEVLSKTYHGYCEVVGNIKQGTEFYSDFLGNLGSISKELRIYLEERRRISVQLQGRLDEMDK